MFFFISNRFQDEKCIYNNARVSMMTRAQGYKCNFQSYGWCWLLCKKGEQTHSSIFGKIPILRNTYLLFAYHSTCGYFQIHKLIKEYSREAYLFFCCLVANELYSSACVSILSTGILKIKKRSVFYTKLHSAMHKVTQCHAQSFTVLCTKLQSVMHKVSKK